MWPLETRPAVAALVVLTAALMLPVCAARAIAQANTGEVGGIVRDHSGGALVGAAVVARHAESGAVVRRTTDAQGRFFLPALRTGAWDITASLDGFAPQTRRGIVLDIGRTLTLDFVLSVEGVTENVRCRNAGAAADQHR